MNKAIEISTVPIREVKPNPKNRNKHSSEQIDRLCEIIKYQGFRTPLIVSTRSGLLVAGHGRLLAAKQLKLDEVPVIYQDFDSEEQEYAAQVSDNAIASWAELDLSGINFDLPNLGPDFDINMLGIKDFELEPADKYGDKDADATPEIRATEIQRGDMWSLGNHRLRCGDSTSNSDVAALMNGEKADMVFTDPPYGMNLDTDFSDMPSNWSDGGSKERGTLNPKKYKPVEGDALQFNPSICLSLSQDVVLFGADYYAVGLPPGGSWFVWDKRSSAEWNKKIEGMFGSEFELAWSKKKRQRLIARVPWGGLFGNEHEDNRKRVHPTQKPIKLAEWVFNETNAGKLIVDLYLGSGSTLIACEKTNRKCYGMEIDPVYCQVIIDRWEKFTGQKAVKL